MCFRWARSQEIEVTCWAACVYDCLHGTAYMCSRVYVNELWACWCGCACVASTAQADMTDIESCTLLLPCRISPGLQKKATHASVRAPNSSHRRCGANSASGSLQHMCWKRMRASMCLNRNCCVSRLVRGVIVVCVRAYCVVCWGLRVCWLNVGKTWPERDRDAQAALHQKNIDDQRRSHQQDKIELLQRCKVNTSYLLSWQDRCCDSMLTHVRKCVLVT
jgi:hypothetical protein